MGCDGLNDNLMYFLQTKKVLLKPLGGYKSLQTINPKNGNGQSCVQRKQGDYRLLFVVAVLIDKRSKPMSVIT